MILYRIMKKRKEIRSKSSDKLVKMLRIERELRFKDIKLRLDISSTALSRHLKNMTESKIISVEKRGTQKFYSLLNSDFNYEVIKSRLSGHFEYLLNLKIDEDKKINQKFIDDFGKTITTFLFFLLNVSIKTGENWIESFDVNELMNTFLFNISDKLYQDDKLDEFQDLLIKYDYDKPYEFLNRNLDVNVYNIINDIQKIIDAKDYDSEFKIINKIKK